MKKATLVILILFVSNFGFSQKKNRTNSNSNSSEIVKESRKIIMQLTSADTVVHKMLIKQIKNILSVAPDTKIEVVCHGPGLNLLIAEKTIVFSQITEIQALGVDFAACQFSMKERNVSDEQLINSARKVEAGIIEIVDKQNLGWAYIKAGN